MNITLIASDNGLGHIKRLVYLSNILINQHNVSLMAPKNLVKKFKLNRNIKLQNFEMRINVKKNSYNYEWIRKIKNDSLNKTDLFISDNLPEIFELKKNSYLYANFLWHKILKIKKKIKMEKDNLIKRNNLPVLGCYLFMHPQVSNNFKITKIGLFGSFKGRKKNKIQNILISLGTAKLGILKVRKVKKELEKIFQYFKKKVNFYIDPALGKITNKNKNIKIFKANYSSQMFKKIDLAIIKPGLGTVNSCLEYSIPIFTYMSDFNEEFTYNAYIIKKNNLGFKIDNLIKLPKMIKKIDKEFFEKHYLLCKKLKWNGEKEIKKIINLNYQ